MAKRTQMNRWMVHKVIPLDDVPPRRPCDSRVGGWFMRAIMGHLILFWWAVGAPPRGRAGEPVPAFILIWAPHHFRSVK